MLCKIRRLDRSELQLLRRLRIAALEGSPDQFGETALAARERSDEEWLGLVTSAHVAELDGDSVGMVFAFDDQSDPSVGRLGGMWVAPGARRVGVGSALLAAVRAWATACGKRCVRLWVVPTSPGAALYECAQFVSTGASKPFPGDPDRTVIEMELELSGTG